MPTYVELNRIYPFLKRQNYRYRDYVQQAIVLVDLCRLNARSTSSVATAEENCPAIGTVWEHSRIRPISVGDI